MEQKTIGKFITTLRKANGMTQKDLAEKLNVSDKTVSRWERDEGAPDLSMIPILAEIFDVTCDELLRGERKSPVERKNENTTGTSADKEELSSKSEKQLKRLLKVTFSQYQSRTYIAIGLSVIGIIMALIGNLAFLNAVLGGLLGAIFYAASIVCQAIFQNRALLSVEDACLDQASLSSFKRNVIRLTQKSIGFTAACMGFSLPLILVDAYMGLGPDSLLIFGLLGAAAFLLIYAVILYFYNAFLVERELYPLEEKEAAAYHHNHKLQGKCALVLALLLVLTFSVQQMATSIEDGPFPIMKGTTFEDYESFTAYMEEFIPHESFLFPDIPITEFFPEYPDDYAGYGTERTLTDKNGTVVCEYIDRNEIVYSMNYTPKDGTVLPITVYTYYDLEEARRIADSRTPLFLPVYGIEIAAIVWFYMKKRMK